jgi:hypothetical protein
MPMYVLKTKPYGKAESKAPIIITVILLVFGGAFAYYTGVPRWKEYSVKQEVQSALNIDVFKRDDRDRANVPSMKDALEDRVKKVFGKMLQQKSLKVQVKQHPKDQFRFRAKVVFVYEMKYPLQSKPKEKEMVLTMETQKVEAK